MAMALQELYANIGGDYDQAVRVLSVEKLIDKHIRKLTKNGLITNLLAAGETMDPTRLFETAHAAKGVCANLGLVSLSDAVSEITEEFRPGAVRKYSDEEVREKLRKISEQYRMTEEGIRQYEEA